MATAAMSPAPPNLSCKHHRPSSPQGTEEPLPVHRRSPRPQSGRGRYGPAGGPAPQMSGRPAGEGREEEPLVFQAVNTSTLTMPQKRPPVLPPHTRATACRVRPGAPQSPMQPCRALGQSVAQMHGFATTARGWRYCCPRPGPLWPPPAQPPCVAGMCLSPTHCPPLDFG